MNELTLKKVHSGDVVGEKFINKNLLVRSATTAHDLSATDRDLTVVYTGEQAGDITLPQATAQNVGMKIKIIFAADCSGTAFKLGYASGGSTVMFGTLDVTSTGSPTLDAVVSFPITDNAKNLVMDDDAVATAGGAKGSMYTFCYYGSNTVHVYGRGIVTTGTIATDASASVTGGI
tara:strand:- start:406 stop:933 length:528 start_codon:yes stop_codon:yes gene_type:complete